MFLSLAKSQVKKLFRRVSPMPANERALRKNAAGSEVKLHKQVAMRSKRAFNDSDARGGQGFLETAVNVGDFMVFLYITTVDLAIDMSNARSG